ncbi:MAG: DUF1573 domain-containing protein [Bacteroidetes bacterium]|nr:DUF1573 domain-containing protein [Bacteroidota bacterium]
MKYTIALGLIFALSLSLYAQDAPSDSQVPLTTLEFDHTEYDFGEITSGEKVTHVFTFTNTGDQPLLLTNAKGSCGCTVPRWPRKAIQPGETASITVAFNSKNKRGKRNQKVTITANTEPAQTFLFLKGTVLEGDDEDWTKLSQEEVAEIKPDPNCFAIYPNPTADILKLDMEDYMGEEVIVSIFSQNGSLMAKRQLRIEDNPIEFQVNHFPAGTYIANVQVPGQETETRCFIVVK